MEHEALQFAERVLILMLQMIILFNLPRMKVIEFDVVCVIFTELLKPDLLILKGSKMFKVEGSILPEKLLTVAHCPIGCSYL